MTLLGIGKCSFEKSSALIDGQTVILRVANDVSPSKVVGFEGSGDREQVIEFRQGNELI